MDFDEKAGGRAAAVAAVGPLRFRARGDALRGPQSLRVPSRVPAESFEAAAPLEIHIFRVCVFLSVHEKT